MNVEASLVRAIRFIWLTLIFSGMLNACAAHDDLACTLSHLLAPSPAMKVVFDKGDKGGLEKTVAQVLAKMSAEDRLRIIPCLVFSAAAKNARAPHAGTETGWMMLDEKTPLILALRYLCELHQCGMRFVGDEVRMYSLDEMAEFPARRYRLSPALVSFLLGRKIEAEALKGLLKDENLLGDLMEVLDRRKLQMEDSGPDNDWISLRGASLAHEAFEAEIQAWAVQVQRMERDRENAK